MKLAPSKAQLDQLLLHHVLVKIQQIEHVQNELKQKNEILEKMSNLVQGKIPTRSDYSQFNEFRLDYESC